MKYSWALCFGILLFGCTPSQPEESFTKLLIRSPYADENLEVFVEITDATKIKSLHAILLRGTEIGPITSAPYHRFEFLKSDGSILQYDFVPYREGNETLFFCYGDKIFSVPITPIRNWFQDAGVSFEKYVELPDEATR